MPHTHTPKAIPKNAHREIEVRFLEIDVPKLKKRLKKLKAKDFGEDLLEETIIYDKALTWNSSNKRLRLRTRRGKILLSYKHHKKQTADGTEEIEFEVSDARAAEAFLERLGFQSFRKQQKLRHTYKLNDVIIDIDTWPRMPAYIELEGESEQAIKTVAKKLELDWKEVVFDEPRRIIEKRYGIPIGTMKHFTFNKFE